ncbi:MAG: hypothetical protein JST42_03630 [Bacteroidetes bacterium]|nr:hypothetical protein [Bacteroidota bacterium]
MRSLFKAPFVSTAACILLSIAACNNANSNMTASLNSALASGAPAGDAPVSGAAYVSYEADGQSVMITGQHLFINDVSNNSAKGVVTINVTNFGKNPAEVIHIIAHNKGVTAISHSAGGGAPFNSDPFADIMIQNQNHYADAAEVNITQITTDYVEGAFSGKFTGRRSMSDKSKETITITNGKFHLPFRKS